MRKLTRLLAVAVVLFAAFTSRAQTTTTTVRYVTVDMASDISTEQTNSLALVEGEYAELVWYSKPSNIGVNVNHEGTNGVSLVSFGLITTPDYLVKPLGAGPGTLQFRYFATSNGTMRYARAVVKITKTETVEPSLPQGGIPSTAVVIPADASGPVQVVLESSSDLVNWTPASPGSYASTETKRFFRVRAVKE